MVEGIVTSPIHFLCRDSMLQRFDSPERGQDELFKSPGIRRPYVFRHVSSKNPLNNFFA